jgi:hypothetical protein
LFLPKVAVAHWPPEFVDVDLVTAERTSVDRSPEQRDRASRVFTSSVDGRTAWLYLDEARRPGDVVFTGGGGTPGAAVNGYTLIGW